MRISRTCSGMVASIGDADDGAEPAAAHELLDRLEKVVRLQFLDRELGVARDAERV